MTDFNDRFLRLLRSIAANCAQNSTLDTAALQILDQEGLLQLCLNAGAHVAPEAKSWVQNRVAAIKLRDQLHARVLDRLAAVNRQLPDPILLFKGEALARTLYPDSSSRQRSDLDLLVPEHALNGTLDTLQSAGFRLRQAQISRFARFEVVLDAGLPIPVGLDLHIRPFFRPWRLQHRPYERLLADGARLPSWPEIPVPSEADAMLIAALHLAKNPHQRGIWWYDLFLLRQAPNTVATALDTPLSPADRAIVTSVLTTSAAIFESSEAALSLPSLTPSNRLQAWRRDAMMLPGWAARLRFLAELLGVGVRSR